MQMRPVCGKKGPLFISHIPYTLMVDPLYARTEEEHEALLPWGGVQAVKDPLKPINTQAQVSTEGLCVLKAGHGKGQDRLYRRVTTIRATVARTHKHGKDEGKIRPQRSQV